MRKISKRSIAAISLLIPGTALLFVESGLAGIMAGACLGVSLCALLRLALPQKTIRPPVAPMSPTQRMMIENQLLEKAENDVAEESAIMQTTPLGSEFQRKQWQQTETAVDEMLEGFMAVICGKLTFCTAGIFFPSANGSYSIRRYTSASEYVNGSARIIPRRGILGSLLAEGLRSFYEPNFTNKNSTLFYYDEKYNFKPEETIRSIMLHPVEAAGEARGILLVDSTKENAFTKDDQIFLGHIAKVMGMAIYYTYLNTAHNLDYQRLAAVSSIEKDFWKDLEFDAVMDKMRGIIPHAVPCDRLTISLKEEDKMAASITRVYGEGSEGFNKLKFRLDSDARSIASLAYTKEFGFSRNFVEDRYEPRYAEDEPQINGFASFMVVPFGIDKLKGLLLIESTKKDAFTSFNLDLLSRIATSAGLALEKISIIRKFDDLATHDGLTELYNHRQFQKILSTKIKACARPEVPKPLSLVLCDIDHFKNLNDTYGHPFGDAVLKGVAAKLKNCIRVDIDAAARYGGEEFALIFDETDSATARELAERIRAAIEAMTFMTVDGTEVKKTMSFGIASFNEHARDVKELISKADKALYDAKKGGRNRVVVY